MKYINALLMRPIVQTVFIFLFFLGTYTANAQERFYQDITGTSIQPGTSFVVEDDKFQTSAWSTIEYSESPRNLVVLEVDHDNSSVINLPDDIIVDLQITFEDQNNVSTVITESLELIYDPTLTNRSEDQAFAMYDGAHRMTIDILAIHVNTISMNPVPPTPYSIRLSGEIYIDRISNHYT